ncbi:MAG: bifunctional class I SAM-dependent methyltransferase/glycosyltransferase family 2 protein [Chloroflexi bacterium]|nr:bifunctional class I SAM-dependent methyltransferase/glycosyltransferase family 2 protein [Chloroflexota bacterium]
MSRTSSHVRPHATAHAAQQAYTRLRSRHWDDVAASLDLGRDWSSAYHARLVEVYRSVVSPNQRVLEIGCGQGDLLAALKPSFGLGVDVSGGMVRRAAQRHPQLRFVQADAHLLDVNNQTFDVVILSDVVNDLWDVEVAFGQLNRLTRPDSRLIVNFYSRLWELPLDITRALGLAKPLLEQNWLTVEDVDNLLHLADFEMTRNWDEILVPVRLAGVERLANRYLARLWPLHIAALTHFVVARPAQRADVDAAEPLVSVVVPARNESGNIADIFDRTPEMGRGTELIFVEGHSTDGTCATIEREMARRPARRCQLLRQAGTGKGDAVRLGFAAATGEVLMILDADLTVAPEDLPRFLDALRSGKGEFINGVRLVYPMQKQAMRFLNLLGNKFFSLAFSWLLGQSIKDTLCGTKVLWAADYRRIADQRAYFGDFDPFGDFDLLFGAAKLNLKIVDLPIRYRERTYGTTNIQRWRHGWLLLQMVLFAARRIKFV